MVAGDFEFFGGRHFEDMWREKGVFFENDVAGCENPVCNWIVKTVNRS